MFPDTKSQYKFMIFQYLPHPPDVEHLRGASEGVSGVRKGSIQKQVAEHLRVVVHRGGGSTEGNWK